MNMSLPLLLSACFHLVAYLVGKSRPRVFPSTDVLVSPCHGLNRFRHHGSYNNLVGLQKEDLTMREAGGNSERAKVLARGLFRYLSRDLLGETAPRPLGL